MAAKCLRKLIDLDSRLQLFERALDSAAIGFQIYELYRTSGGTRYMVRNVDYPQAAAIVRELDPAQYDYLTTRRARASRMAI